MRRVVRRHFVAILKTRCGNQNVGVTNQLTLLMKHPVYPSSSNNDAISQGEYLHGIVASHLVICDVAFFAMRPRRLSKRVMIDVISLG